MPVVEAVRTFVGIANENEFYSHHYLSEVLTGDIKERLEQWAAAEAAHPEQRAPYKQLASRASQRFALRNTVSRGGTAAEQLDSFRHVQQGLLQALGYAMSPQHLELQAGMPVPVWQVIGDPGKAPQVLVVPAYNPGQEEDDILDQRLAAVHYAGVPVCPCWPTRTVGPLSHMGCSGRIRHPGSLSWWACMTGSCSIASSGPTAAPCALTGARCSTARTHSPCRPQRRYCTATRWLPTVALAC